MESAGLLSADLELELVNHVDEVIPIIKQNESEADSDAGTREWNGASDCRNYGPGPRRLDRGIYLKHAVALTLGSIIGSGIFISPKIAYEHSGSVGVMFTLWTLCAGINVLASLCYCELGCAFPTAGGDYVYIHECYGGVFAFLYSWSMNLVMRPGGLAVLTLTFGQYVCPVVAGDHCSNPFVVKAFAVSCLLVVVLFNVFGVRVAARAMIGFTTAKVMALAFIILTGGLVLASGQSLPFWKNAFANSTADPTEIALAFYGTYWAFSGFNTLNVVMEEVHSPARTLQLNALISIPLVTVLYLSVLASYTALLSRSEFLAHDAVALRFSKKVYPPSIQFVMPLLIAISCLGAAINSMFASGRIMLAAAKRGHMPAVFARIDEKRRCPTAAMALTTFLVLGYLLPPSSTIENLISYVSFSDWIFIGSCFLAVIIMRWTRSTLVRPFKVWLPVPIILVLVAIFLVVFPIARKPWTSMMAVVMLLSGLPAYFVLVKHNVSLPRKLSQFCLLVDRKVTSSFNLVDCADDSYI